MENIDCTFGPTLGPDPESLEHRNPRELPRSFRALNSESARSARAKALGSLGLASARFVAGGLGPPRKNIRTYV